MKAVVVILVGCVAVAAGQSRQELCQAPRVTGPCRAAFRRWHFDHEKGKCVQFIYGGCHGNYNNHRSQDECESKCMGDSVYPSHSELCLAPAEVGPCEAMMPRWFFDRDQGQCAQFIYGGCQGNMNNHRSRKECESKCITRKKREDRPKAERVPYNPGACYKRVKNMKVSEGLVGKYIPQCDRNGFYEVVQFHPSSGYSWCAHPLTGEKLSGSETAPGDYKQPECPECYKQLAKTTSGRGLLLGTFVLRCTADGKFDKTQCHTSTGYCWCVDEVTGEEVEDTKIRFEKPSC